MTYRWVDQRIHIWLLPLSAIVILGITLLFSVFPFLIYFGDKGMGASEERKIAVTLISIFFLLGGLYACIGLYQIFVNEIRKLFIVRKAEQYSDRLDLWGYYFKKDTFDLSQVESIDSFSVQKWKKFRVPWKNMMTLFNYERPDSNYKVTLKDGREFYLPGEMTDVDELKALLES